jgi:hypothetical protein
MCFSQQIGENGQQPPLTTKEIHLELTPITSAKTNTGTQSTVETKSNRCNNKIRSKEAKCIIYSQNIQGAKDPLKVEYITNMMKERGIDIFFLQETWLTGNFIKDVNGFLMFHHGLESPICKIEAPEG